MDQDPQPRTPLHAWNGTMQEKTIPRRARDDHRGYGRPGSLTALLDVPPHELLGVLFEHGVDLVEEIVDVLADLLNPVADLRVRLGPGALVKLFVLAGLARLRLAASVAGSHPRPPPTVVRETYLDRTGFSWR